MDRALRVILGNLAPSIDIYLRQFGPVIRSTPEGALEAAFAFSQTVGFF
ncbi:hypothetical protein [Mesorhizobium sp. AR10]|nr:hypothetical protein [Mesorhizobium sp. AR10]